ncbi:MAG: TlpA family protein disulfide reductase [Chlorobi bacterium]|nr:TlpA family protein disulfide reductase [Chlorobiota bacterium]
MNRFLITIILLFVYLLPQSQNITIKGTEKSYAGNKLVFYSYTDLITNSEKELVKCPVDSSGNFECSFKINNTVLAYVYLGVYKGFIFLEPDSAYIIKLPPYTPKTFGDKINPYFKEDELYLGIVNTSPNELNYLIKKFDNDYNTYVDNNFNMLSYRGTSKVDTMINKLDEKYNSFENPYFQNYLYYKLTALRHLSYLKNNNLVVHNYFLNRPILYNNIAYMDLFNQLFNNYFYLYSKTKNGERIFSDVAYAKSVFRIKETLDNNLALANDTLKELIILKACYDECYQNNFPFTSIIQTLDSLIILSKIPEHIDIAKNIIKKTEHLRVGYNAPDFELYDSLHNVVSLKDFRSRYLYINFCTNWSYTCKEEFSLLKNIVKNHSDKLTAISIVSHSDFKEMSAYFNANGYNWPLYYYKGDSMPKQYNVKVYPTYYLIDPYGKLVMSPAPSPNENFEWRFFKVLQSRK